MMKTQNIHDTSVSRLSVDNNSCGMLYVMLLNCIGLQLHSVIVSSSAVNCLERLSPKWSTCCLSRGTLNPTYSLDRWSVCELCVLFQTGQLNEYTERKEMSFSVICMALGRVPAGEQRSRFLAVGLADNTIRIISLQPQVDSRHCSFDDRLVLELSDRPSAFLVCS